MVAQTKIQEIDAKTLKQWIEADQVQLIDVREPGEYAAERIKTATLIPLSNFNPQTLPLIPGKTLVLQCQSSNRSGKAAQKMIDNGFNTVIHLRGGLNAWKEAGYPVERSKNAPISLMRQVQIIAGSLVFIGTILGAFVSPKFLILSGFVGAGLIFAGVTGFCGMAVLLAKLPYNKNVKL